MRILYLNPCGQMGGAETSLMELLSSIRTAEPTWELSMVLGEDGPLAERAKSLGVQVIVEPFPRSLARLGDSGNGLVATLWSALKGIPSTLSYAGRLGRRLAAVQPDLVHTNGFKMHILGIWTRPSGTPVVWHIRDYVSSRFLMSRLLHLHAGRCAAVIGNSRSVVRDIQRVCGRRTEAICIYNAVDLTRYSPHGEESDLASLSGLAPAEAGTLRIGLISTLAHWKGHTVFLRALARLQDEVNYRAYVIGGAIYQTENSQRTLDELRELASELGIADRVGFTGFVQYPARAIRALDVIVHASTEPEPFGRVIAEGMACGRAVICSASGGAAELITEGHDALAHPPGDDAALADRIAKLARNPELRASLGRTGRITAEGRFDLGRLAKEVIPIYLRVCGQTTPVGAEQLAASR